MAGKYDDYIGRPSFVCERRGASWRFWCPYCNRYHYHGAAGGPGHRVAHCIKGPLKATGYCLLPPGDYDRYRWKTVVRMARAAEQN